MNDLDTKYHDKIHPEYLNKASDFSHSMKRMLRLEEIDRMERKTQEMTGLKIIFFPTPSYY